MPPAVAPAMRVVSPAESTYNTLTNTLSKAPNTTSQVAPDSRSPNACSSAFPTSHSTANRIGKPIIAPMPASAPRRRPSRKALAVPISKPASTMTTPKDSTSRPSPLVVCMITIKVMNSKMPASAPIVTAIVLRRQEYAVLRSGCPNTLAMLPTIPNVMHSITTSVRCRSIHWRVVP